MWLVFRKHDFITYNRAEPCANLLASLMMATEILIFFPRKMRMRTKISSSSVPIIPTEPFHAVTVILLHTVLCATAKLIILPYTLF